MAELELVVVGLGNRRRDHLAHFVLCVLHVLLELHQPRFHLHRAIAPRQPIFRTEASDRQSDGKVASDAAYVGLLAANMQLVSQLGDELVLQHTVRSRRLISRQKRPISARAHVQEGYLRSDLVAVVVQRLEDVEQHELQVAHLSAQPCMAEDGERQLVVIANLKLQDL